MIVLPSNVSLLPFQPSSQSASHSCDLCSTPVERWFRWRTRAPGRQSISLAHGSRQRRHANCRRQSSFLRPIRALSLRQSLRTHPFHVTSSPSSCRSYFIQHRIRIIVQLFCHPRSFPPFFGQTFLSEATGSGSNGRRRRLGIFEQTRRFEASSISRRSKDEEENRTTVAWSTK